MTSQLLRLSSWINFSGNFQDIKLNFFQIFHENFFNKNIKHPKIDTFKIVSSSSISNDVIPHRWSNILRYFISVVIKKLEWNHFDLYVNTIQPMKSSPVMLMTLGYWLLMSRSWLSYRRSRICELICFGSDLVFLFLFRRVIGDVFGVFSNFISGSDVGWRFVETKFDVVKFNDRFKTWLLSSVLFFWCWKRVNLVSPFWIFPQPIVSDLPKVSSRFNDFLATRRHLSKILTHLYMLFDVVEAKNRISLAPVSRLERESNFRSEL